jgi:hypothetical protein
MFEPRTYLLILANPPRVNAPPYFPVFHISHYSHCQKNWKVRKEKIPLIPLIIGIYRENYNASFNSYVKRNFPGYVMREAQKDSKSCGP